MEKKTNNVRRRVGANLTGLVAVFLMMAAAAMTVNGRLLGHSPAKSDTDQMTASGDTVIVNTTEIASDVIGYSGPTPVEIRLVDGRIVSVTPLTNSETPGFFKRVVNEGLLDSWNGKTPREALATEVDGVTGATFSSRAIIKNVRAGLETIADTDETVASDETKPLDATQVAVIAVIIAAMSVPLFVKNKRYRTAQQLLNVAILGFWGGTFVDYTMLLNVVSNSLTAAASLTTVLLLTAAFIYPLFGKAGYYCAWICPLGSLQELASRCNPNHRLHLSPKTVKALTTTRMLLWGALMLCLWTALWTGWIDYELFTAFIVESAAAGVLIAGGAIVIISLFIPRPYCRFICPTGTLLRMAQDLNTK